MKAPAKLLALSAFSTSVVGVVACWYIVSRYEQAFEATTNGESYSLVVERFGTPSVIELPGQEFSRYASKGCIEPCSVRAWWEHPVLRGIEAWSVEFNEKNQVIHTVHWVSP
ncbi:hypothetical protein [uncultured Propionivibrio sp.]|uniref:hypothetical protein n=1 Tax=uncultured Propionivibrio sp. TaxID=426737 RepID=UPI0029C06247|nr:hypothetical protein [uncultured Propionivibrio sp.]